MSNNVDALNVPVPDYQSLMRPVLEAAADGAEHSLAAIRQKIAGLLGLSEADVAERLTSGSQTVFANRIAWAVQYLKAAGALKSVRRGVYRIKERGLSLVKTNPNGITVQTLSRFPEFAEFHGRDDVGEDEPVAPAEPADLDTPDESLSRSFELRREALATELLDLVQNCTPAAFEKLVIDLLVAMGYGGSVEDAGSVVGRSGDGGIDGIIKEDKLGLAEIYVQAKRWKDSVGSPEIMKFSGGLTKKHAARGVFITASSFTKDASEYVKALPQKIVLIDGKRLASLMIEHNVGVPADKTFTLKRLDPSYFEHL